MIQYNYADENYQAGVAGLKKTASKGIPVIVMEPLLGGQLATGLPKTAISHFKKANPEISPVAWAFRWLWNQPEVTLLLSGMNDIKQLDENIIIAETAMPNMLSENELETFKDVKKIFHESFKVYCTGCHYCMPCPFNVNIPACFTAYNTYHSISKYAGNMQYLMSTMLSEKSGYAGLCKKCGKCEPLCPQHIPVVKSLSDVEKKMEKPFFKIMAFGMKFFMRKKKNQGGSSKGKNNKTR
jgi:predicted aldo/keto reductase-like oxidoreductase